MTVSNALKPFHDAIQSLSFNINSNMELEVNYGID